MAGERSKVRPVPTRHPRNPIGALTKSAIGTENATGIAVATVVTRTIVTIPETAGTIATATREGLILSRGPGVAEDDELSN